MGNRQLAAVVPTAFRDDGTLDRDAQVALSASYTSAGCSRLIALDATGGEAESLDPDERDQVVRAVREGASGSPVYVGVGIADAAAAGRAHRAGMSGADGLVVMVPQRRGPTAERLADLAELGLPLWFHHHPLAAGSDADLTETVAFAAELGVEAVLVEATPTADLVAEVVAAGQRAYGGLAGLFLPEELDAGAAGTTAASAVPERLADVLGDVPDEGPMPLDAYLAVLPYLRLEAGSSGLTVRKEAWRQRGVLSSGRMRRGHPLGRATKGAITRRLREVGVAPRDPYPGA